MAVVGDMALVGDMEVEVGMAVVEAGMEEAVGAEEMEEDAVGAEDMEEAEGTEEEAVGTEDMEEEAVGAEETVEAAEETVGGEGEDNGNRMFDKLRSALIWEVFCFVTVLA